jgi:acetyltransferase-like isoleucine patch superfamily enzyme
MDSRAVSLLFFIAPRLRNGQWTSVFSRPAGVYGEGIEIGDDATISSPLYLSCNDGLFS